MFVWAAAACRWIYVCAEILHPVVCKSVVFAEAPAPRFKMTSACKSWSHRGPDFGFGGTRPVGAAVQTVGSVAAAVHWLASPRWPRPLVPIGSTAPKSSELAVARPCGTCEGQNGRRKRTGLRGRERACPRALSAGCAGMFHAMGGMGGGGERLGAPHAV